MVDLHLSILITLSVNGLNMPISRLRLSGLIKESKTQLYTVYKKSTLALAGVA